MKMRIPAPRNVEITSGISLLGGSAMATIPTIVNPVLACSTISFSNAVDDERDEVSIDDLEIALCARSSTRRPCEDHSFLIMSIFSLAAAFSTMFAPEVPV